MPPRHLPLQVVDASPLWKLSSCSWTWWLTRYSTVGMGGRRARTHRTHQTLSQCKISDTWMNLCEDDSPLTASVTTIKLRTIFYIYISPHSAGVIGSQIRALVFLFVCFFNIIGIWYFYAKGKKNQKRYWYKIWDISWTIFHMGIKAAHL